MIDIRALIDDSKCFRSIRSMGRPDGVRCPECGSAEVTKAGRDDTQPETPALPVSRGCRKRFDDLTGTVFAGHLEPLRAWVLCLYFRETEPLQRAVRPGVGDRTRRGSGDDLPTP